jgi:hypothetical protein
MLPSHEPTHTNILYRKASVVTLLVILAALASIFLFIIFSATSSATRSIDALPKLLYSQNLNHISEVTGATSCPNVTRFVARNAAGISRFSAIGLTKIRDLGDPGYLTQE